MLEVDTAHFKLRYNIATGSFMQEFDILHDATQLVLQIAVIIVCALISDKISEKFSLPHVIGYIVIGVVIGPFILGHIPLGTFFPEGLFPKIAAENLSVSPSLYNLATIASVILLFYSGLETDVSLFLRYAAKGTIIGLGGLVISFFGGYYFSLLFFSELSPTHPTHLFVGTIATATSVGITTSVLSAKKKVSSPEGVTILSAAVFDDVIGIVLLAIVMGIAEVHSTTGDSTSITVIALRSLGLWIGFTALGIFFAKKLGSGLKKAIASKTRIAILVLGIAFLLGAVFEMFGLSMIIGAYIVGLTLSNTDLSYVIQEKLYPIMQLFVPVFFIVSGMQIDIINFVRPDVFLLGIVYSVICMITKFFGTGIPALGIGFNTLGSARIGMGMMPRGEVALIIGSIGLSAGIVSGTLYNVIMMMIISNSLIAPLFLQLLLTSKQGTRTEEKSTVEKTSIDFQHWQLTRFIVADFLTLMEEEGFFINKTAQREKNIYHIRKDHMFITLHSFTEGTLIFFSDKQSIPFFKTALYEATANIAESAQILKERVSFIATNTLDTASDKFIDTKSKDSLLSPILSPFLVELSIQARTKEELLTELTNHLNKGGYLSDKELFLRDLFERERTFSTGMQNGVAIPHAKSNGCKEPKIVIGIKRDGIDFDSLDKEPSTIFVLIATPKNYAHLAILTHISTLLQHESFRKKLLESDKETDVIRLFTQS